MEPTTDPFRIYPFHDGKAMVNADPLRVHRRLIHACDGKPNDVIRATRSEDEEERFKATEKLIQAAVFAFEVEPYNRLTGQGMTDTDLLKLVANFNGWLQKKNAITAPTPTSAPPSDSGRHSSPSDMASTSGSS